jgi:hypothetical protein
MEVIVSIEALNYALNLELPEVDGTTKPLLKFVLVGIANHANPRGEAWPAIDRLSKYTGFSTRSIQRAISELVRMDLLRIEEKPGRTNLYIIRAFDESRGDTMSGVTPCQGGVSPCHPNHKEPSSNNNRASRLPDDFNPSEANVEWAKSARPDVDLKDATDQFKDYWLGNGKTKLDWQATWRNWIRRTDPARSRTNLRNNPAALAQSNRQRSDELLSELGEYGPSTPRLIDQR